MEVRAFVGGRECGAHELCTSLQIVSCLLYFYKQGRTFLLFSILPVFKLFGSFRTEAAVCCRAHHCLCFFNVVSTAGVNVALQLCKCSVNLI